MMIEHGVKLRNYAEFDRGETGIQMRKQRHSLQCQTELDEAEDGQRQLGVSRAGASRWRAVAGRTDSRAARWPRRRAGRRGRDDAAHRMAAQRAPVATPDTRDIDDARVSCFSGPREPPPWLDQRTIRTTKCATAMTDVRKTHVRRLSRHFLARFFARRRKKTWTTVFRVCTVYDLLCIIFIVLHIGSYIHIPVEVLPVR